MTCARCGSELELVDSEGGITSGDFIERYQCIRCGAWGKVRGEASDEPTHWTEQGPAMEGGI